MKELFESARSRAACETQGKRKFAFGAAWALIAAAAAFVPNFVAAQDASPAEQITELKVAADTLWVMVAGFLVFFMNAGFALLEAGLCRAKNTSTILAKNFIVFAAATLAFWLLGFNLMFAEMNDYIGLPAIGLLGSEYDAALDWSTAPVSAKFFFQLVFAATAATIVSGCVNERSKLWTFLVFSIVLTAVIYPISGHWIWGAGWLGGMGFWDFAGSTVVHSVGAWAGLAGILVVGPRLGRYGKDGRVNPVPGHSMPLATLGALILWLGWFGFNPGSTMAADAGAIAHVAVTTNLAAAAGALVATFVANATLGKPDITMTLNGCLAGLVAITAPCAWVTPLGAVAIGAIGGALVVFAVPAFDKAKLDDPVGALSVHLVNGVWGTLAIGLFASPEGVGYEAGVDGPLAGLFYGGGATQLGYQLIGVVAVGAYAFIASYVLWYALKLTMGVRVSVEEETEGLDIHEIGVGAYNDDALGPHGLPPAASARVASGEAVTAEAGA